MIPEILETPRLHASRLSAEHFDALRRLDTDPAAMAQLGGVRDEATTRAYLEKQSGLWVEHGFGFYIITDRATGELAGRGGIRPLTLEGSAEVEIEVGYGFLSPYWGRGLATEFAAACRDLAFAHLQARSIVALTTESNVASQRVLQKVGMRRERDLLVEGRPLILFRGIQDGADD